jgi:hypothetical protein
VDKDDIIVEAYAIEGIDGFVHFLGHLMPPLSLSL